MIEKCYVNRKQNGTHTFPCSFVFVCLFAQRDTKGLTCFGFMFCFLFCFIFFLRREVTTFFRALLFLELCCFIPCNWIYNNLFLIGSWTTTSWVIYHQAFSVVIPIWSGRMAFETCISSGKFVREIDYQRNICKEICQRNYSGIEFRSLNLFLFLK